jgi:hypothetical protein
MAVMSTLNALTETPRITILSFSCSDELIGISRLYQVLCNCYNDTWYFPNTFNALYHAGQCAKFHQCTWDKNELVCDNCEEGFFGDHCECQNGNY